MPMRFLSPWTGGSRNLNVFDQFENFFNEFDRGIVPAANPSGVDFAPPIDLEEDENSYLVSIDLPGMKKNDIKIDCTEDVLTVSGERSREVQGERKYSERPYGVFQRFFKLPSHVEVNNIKAAFEDGVLTVTLPKTAESKTRTIKIS
ncbi:MAG: Hsp20/alpha crystallin family protein [Pseudobdellovibrionaceae bacterium]